MSFMPIEIIIRINLGAVYKIHKLFLHQTKKKKLIFPWFSVRSIKLDEKILLSPIMSCKRYCRWT